MAKVALSLLASTALAAPSVFAGELPNGASVAGGRVTIGTNGSAMTVTQGSDRAIVNWNGFSVGQGSSVTFIQPDKSSAILNRVTGSTTSSIAGSISANGQVYLVNPNGIAITSTGTVKVGGGFVASTLDIADEDFLKGNLNFSGNGASAGIANEGVVTVGRGGYAALIGGTVKNDGLIAVPMGKAALGSGEQATLDLSGDGFLQVAVPTKAGAEGDGALIENSGTIAADGGTVVMKAATAREAARQAINLSGVAEAKTVSGKNGEIVIGGGEGGTVAVSGKAFATGKSTKNDKGGKITVTGKAVALKGATVDASGSTGGGTVKIGGDWQGSGDTQRAETTSVDAKSTIRADATEAGDGGTVVVWSDDLTRFAGTITAKGAGAGNGGNAEVSGKAVLDYFGIADLSASSGTFGNLLLDPYNITISSANAGMSGLVANGNDSVLNVNTLTSQLALANVTVSTGSSGTQDGNITVAAPIAWSANTVLTLAAAGNIAFNSAVTATGGSAGLVIQYGLGKDYTIKAPITLSGTNATLQIGETGNLQAYTLIHDMTALDNIDIDATGLAGKYALAQNIDASGITYTNSPVDGEFTGTFTGLGNTITGLTISTSAKFTGLFGENAGTIRDVGLLAAGVSSIVTDDGHAGILVGFNGVPGTIRNSYAEGTSEITVDGRDYLTGSAGGLVGLNFGEIANSHATATVSASSSSNQANAAAGGLVGTNNGLITSSFASGSASSETSISGSYTYIYSYAGGLAGINSGTIANSYATGTVEAASSAMISASYSGGLVGANHGSISNSYATGGVSASPDGTYLGGLAGYNHVTGSITASFFDHETTGVSAGVGNGSSSGVTGLSTSQFQNTEYFYLLAVASGWDFMTSWAPSSSGYYPELYALSNVVAFRAADRSMIYGNTMPTLSADIYGAQNDTITYAPTVTTAATSTSNVGTYDILLGGVPANVTSTSGQTYRVVAVPQNGTLTIGKAALTVTANDASKTYDGLAYNGGNGVTYSGFANNETSAVLGGSLAYGGSAQGAKNAGTYGITASGLTSGNYDITYAAGGLTVGKAALTVTANDASKTYDGLAWSGNNGVTYSGFANNETSAVLGGTLAYGGSAQGAKNAGTYGITASGLTSGNYDITYAAGNLAVGKTALTVTAKDASKTYDGLAYNGGNGVTYSGLVNNETSAVLGGSLAYGGTAQGAKNAGNYGITASGLTSGNYDISYAAGGLTVDKAALTITANDASKTYDGLAYNGSNGVTYSGFVNNETSAVLGGTLAYGGTTQGAKNAGTYGITASGLTSGNYDISYVAGGLTVNKAALTVTANDASKTYDGLAYNGSNGVTYSGFVNNETSAVLGGALAYGGTAQGAKNAGNYGITASGLTSGNYDISYAAGGLTVNKAALTVKVNDVSKIYDGMAWWGNNGAILTGFVNGETAAVLGGALVYDGSAQGAINVGQYAISSSGLSSDNYEIGYVNGALMVTSPDRMVPPETLLSNMVMPQWTSPPGQQTIVYASADMPGDGSGAPLMQVEDKQLSGAACAPGAMNNQVCSGSAE
ncbi:MBG domain-containing protein [Rhizobium sp.]|uniref:beta strand repeat-containing protein n=1 Tax=Rhizobium sp. TaxID=391 RepID=UPI0028A8E76E